MSETVLFASVTGDSSVCPYDYHAGLNRRFFGDLLNEAGIDFEVTVKNNDFKPAYGSGPGGRIRFGDGMAPPTVNFHVDKRDLQKAREVFAKRGYAHFLRGDT